MIRRSKSTLPLLLGAAFVATLLAGCVPASASPTPTRRTAPVTEPSGSATPGAVVAGSASASASALVAASDPLGLPHADKDLEATIPAVVGNVQLAKFSLLLAAYMTSTPTAGENALYSPWLVKFGLTPTQVSIAIATDLRPDGINLIIHAIKVPGAGAAALASSFADVASKAGWPVFSVSIVKGKSITEIVDPAAKAAGSPSAGYVYAYGNVLYTVITDDPNLLLEAMIKLP
jgi:hypothetical protein